MTAATYLAKVADHFAMPDVQEPLDILTRRNQEDDDDVDDDSEIGVEEDWPLVDWEDEAIGENALGGELFVV